MYLSFDPGMTTGIAYFDENGKETFKLQVHGIEELYMWIHSFLEPFDTMIYEAYVIRPNVPHGGDEVPAAQVIGILKGFAFANNKVLIKQLAHERIPAYAWQGKVYNPKSHPKDSDQESALAHGLVYLVRNKVVDANDLRPVPRQRT